MSERFRIGALRDLYSQPLYRTLKSSPATTGELLFDTPAVHIDRLLSKECDAAFIAPMDYAINSSDLLIFPNVGATSNGFSGTARLYFRKDMKSITSMAVGAVTTTDVVLARIVLGEKYDSAPAIIPVPGTIDEMLAKADCALMAGNALQSIRSAHPFIDMVDEWNDITELPFVHTLCAAPHGSFNKDLSDLLIVSAQTGRMELQAIADELGLEHSLPSESLLDFLSQFSYDLDATAKESLETFMEMAFLLGMMGDVPDVKIG